MNRANNNILFGGKHFLLNNDPRLVQHIESIKNVIDVEPGHPQQRKWLEDLKYVGKMKKQDQEQEQAERWDVESWLNK